MANRDYYKRSRPLYASPVPKEVAKPKMKWRILPIIWKGIKRTCTVIGAMVLISAMISLWSAATIVKKAAPSLPDEMVLYLKLEDGLKELPGEANFADPFSFTKPTVRELVDAIDHAAEDPRVHGIVARMNAGGFSVAHVQELRAAIKRFREKSDKFAYIYSSSFGESGPGLGRYYLAAAFEERWMQPLGIVSISGLNAEIPFFRTALDKIGVTPQFYQRKEYKTAYESLTNHEISPQNREMTESLITNLGSQMAIDIAHDLKMEPRRFSAMIDKGLFTAAEAESAGLITFAGYADEMVSMVRELLTGDPENEDIPFVEARQYIGNIKKEKRQNPLLKDKGKTRVALVYAVGAIMPSETGATAPAFLGGGKIAAADKIAPAILDAADDEDVEAIILRIDSPGGSPSASESILRATEKAQEKGKPVIVSMGPVAASGGYWIAAYADRIFALPTTITGSIGVVGGKFSARDLWPKLGVNWENIRWGNNAGMWSLNTPFSEGEAERINAMLDQVYDAFIARVSRGRNMEEEKVDAIAGGRVWTGRQAWENGLVDQLGGLTEALDYTAQILGQKNRRELSVVVMPKPKTPVEQFIELLEGNASLGLNGGWQKSLAEFLGPIVRQIDAAANPELYMVYEPLAID